MALILIFVSMGGIGIPVGNASLLLLKIKKSMCKKCGNILCFGCNRPDPPSNLTEKDKERGGWNNQPTVEEEDRIREIARKLVENPTGSVF